LRWWYLPRHSGQLRRFNFGDGQLLVASDDPENGLGIPFRT
jgi:hypothetical protein